MEAWYLVYTKPQQEMLAFENLSRQEYRTYLPRVKRRKRLQRHRRVNVEPMFPRYLFLFLSDVNEDWGPVRSTVGVSRMVRFGGVPAIVPSALVEALRAREDDSGVQMLPEPSYQAGDRVRIAEGLMAGYEAIFSSATGKERVLLLLEIAGKCARVEVSVDYIEPVSGY